MLLPRRKADVFPGELELMLRRCAGAYEGSREAIGAFEAAVKTRVGANGAAAVNSGRRGMELIFRHLKIGAGHEVIIPAYTLKDLATLIERLGAKPVPADIHAKTLNVTAQTITERITSKTKCILILHAFGAPCDLSEITALAAEHALPVVEDCAHALGAYYRGLPVGAQSYAGFYSFEWTKPVNTYGGGMVVSGDEDLIEYIKQQINQDHIDLTPVAAKVRAIQSEERMFRSGMAVLPLSLLTIPGAAHAIESLYRSLQRVPPGGIAYHPLQAELGLQKLGTLEARIAKRERLVSTLRAHLRDDIRLQEVLPGCQSAWYFCVALLPYEAAPIRRRLLMKGIDAGAGHEVADVLGGSACPNATQVSRRAIQLPLYESLDEETMRQIADAVNGAVK